jgi:hypothetical protein
MLIVLIAGKTYASENLFCVNINIQLGVLAGIEHKFNDHIGLRGDFGLAIPGLVIVDALFMVYFLPDTYRWQVGLGVGVPNAGMPFSFDAGMVSLGGTVLTRFKASDKLNIDFRLGAGFPLFFEKDNDVIRDTGFPLGLWPDLMLGVSFELRKRL